MGVCLSFAIFPYTNVCVTLVYICIYIHKCVNWRELWSCGGISVWLAYYRHSAHGTWVLVHVVCMHMHMPPLDDRYKNPEKKHQRAIFMFSCQERADCLWGWRCGGGEKSQSRPTVWQPRNGRGLPSLGRERGVLGARQRRNQQPWLVGELT